CLYNIKYKDIILNYSNWEEGKIDTLTLFRGQGQMKEDLCTTIHRLHKDYNMIGWNTLWPKMTITASIAFILSLHILMVNMLFLFMYQIWMQEKGIMMSYRFNEISLFLYLALLLPVATTSRFRGLDDEKNYEQYLYGHVHYAHYIYILIYDCEYEFGADNHGLNLYLYIILASYYSKTVKIVEPKTRDMFSVWQY
ncbi:hypothetical protein ACJX0J_005366, partial [Zea mays]